jgi:hypothetical protein
MDREIESRQGMGSQLYQYKEKKLMLPLTLPMLLAVQRPDF